MKKVLFLVNGLGLGNSARCHAIIQYLQGRCEVAVMTSGNGIWYFKNYPDIKILVELKSLFYGSKKNKLSILNTILSLKKLIQIMKENNSLIEKYLIEYKPDTVVIDSIYKHTYISGQIYFDAQSGNLFKRTGKEGEAIIFTRVDFEQ